MNGMVIVDEGRVALLSITRQTMQELGGTNDDLEGLINFPLTVKDIEAVAFFKEVGDGDWRVSLRSKGTVDIGVIARANGGGGHTNAAGCAVLATDVDGFRDSLALGETALAVPPNDPSALKTAMIRLIQDARLREQLGRQGRERASAFSWDSIAEKEWIRIRAILD